VVKNARMQEMTIKPKRKFKRGGTTRKGCVNDRRQEKVALKIQNKGIGTDAHRGKKKNAKMPSSRREAAKLKKSERKESRYSLSTGKMKTERQEPRIPERKRDSN